MIRRAFQVSRWTFQVARRAFQVSRWTFQVAKGVFQVARGTFQPASIASTRGCWFCVGDAVFVCIAPGIKLQTQNYLLLVANERQHWEIYGA